MRSTSVSGLHDRRVERDRGAVGHEVHDRGGDALALDGVLHASDARGAVHAGDGDFERDLAGHAMPTPSLSSRRRGASCGG